MSWKYLEYYMLKRVGKRGSFYFCVIITFRYDKFKSWRAGERRKEGRKGDDRMRGEETAGEEITRGDEKAGEEKTGLERRQ